ncbi:DUF502 domain-containing protein [Motiliproteus sp. MSK22-1]|uniref:DUF502 domain-containing protein n=1 Tax=Motiliproteus sp. MSK22-1 TaxID=1897630 RepID=UPI0009757281|nr:DUF502 domain-containing protein [Motiliproteus sp. MSK22-1]OMH28470.1 hypothetical protein BGP75_21490 [Motiliproteus sp. MSK22-1]
MKKISQLFLQGLFAVLPIAITLSILYWLGSFAESTLGVIINWLLPEGWYWPGMGLISGFICILGIGILLNAYIFRRLGGIAESLFERIPLVKTIYNSVRDIAKFAAASQDDDELQKAVTVTLDNDIKLIGFITQKSITLGNTNNLVAVYFPMSYQIGGYTLMLPESRIETLDMSVQDAMRMVLTAAMTTPENDS